MKPFSINTIAMGNLKQHRKQYVTMALGIVLALFFSASLMLFWNSMQVSLQELHNKRYGRQDEIYLNCKDAPFDELAEAGYFSALGKATILEYLSLETPDTNAGVSAAVIDEAALEQIDWEIEGRLPKKAGEIAMEQSALNRLQSDAKIGDTITVSAYIPCGSDGDSENAFLDEPMERTYTLVGILSDHYTFLNDKSGFVTAAYRDFPSAVLWNGEQIAVGGRPIINYYVTYSAKYWAAYNLPGEQCSHYRISCALDGYNVAGFDTRNDDELYSSTDMHNTEQVIGSVMVIAAALILASCLGMINALSSNLQRRRRQIGLLRAVGATRRQIRQIFGREAILIALISIPPAVLLSCLVVWGMMQLMGPNFRFVLNLWILLGTAAVGLLCIMAAAFIPLWNVSRIPPMQAIRDVALSRKMKSRRVRSKKRFDVSTHLAKRNLFLNRGRQVRIISLMTAGMVLLTYLLYTDVIGLDLLRRVDYDSDFSLVSRSAYSHFNYVGLESGYTTPGMTEQDLQDILALESVQNVQTEKHIQINVIPERITDYLTTFGADLPWDSTYLSADLSLVDAESNSYYQEEYQRYLDCMQKYGYTKQYYTTTLHAFDEERIQELSSHLLEGTINLDKLASGEEVLVYAPAYAGAIADPSGDGYYSDHYTKNEEQTARQKCGEYLTENDMFHAGDTITLSQLYTLEALEFDDEGNTCSLPDSVERLDRQVTIGGVIDADNGLLVEKGDVATSIAGLSALGYDAKYSDFEIILSESPNKEMEQYLETQLESIASRSGDTEVTNYVAQARDNRNITYGKMAAGIAVIILLFAICTCMISNAFAAQIQAGKSYIGTLRATGASERDIWKNYFYQLVYLFVRGGIIGIPVSFAAVMGWFLFRRFFLGFANELEYLMEHFGLPSVWPALVFLLLMFVICYINMRRRLKRVLKNSIVENIREL